MASEVRSHPGRIDSDLDKVLKATRQISSESHAYETLANLILISSRIRRSTAGLASKLQDWIQKIKAALEAIAKFLNAATYSVGVSAPFGLSISISFNVK
jgi:hypothetical protein